jgi:Fe-Mn family superoxide dismutase
MFIHHTRHHQAAVDSLNTAIKQVPDIPFGYTLPTLLASIGPSSNWTGSEISTVPENVTRAIRNNAGSHFNHAIFWRTMRPFWYSYDPSRPRNEPSAVLQSAINSAFGNTTAFQENFSVAANRVFGSGWTWLCVGSNGLVVTSTPNQDNPLMTNFVGAAQKGLIPILGLDVWEHAYYLKHRNVRRNYVDAWWNVVDWPRVSANYELALKGEVEKLWTDDE